jgi:hypothetical protein
MAVQSSAIIAIGKPGRSNRSAARLYFSRGLTFFALIWRKRKRRALTSNTLLKNACVDPLVLRDAMLCIALLHKFIYEINALAIFLRSRWKRRL